MLDEAESPSRSRKARKPAPLYVEDLRRFKGFARKLQARSPGNKGGMLMEWASSVTDLHRILDVTKSLFLINQSHNEILLRVGLELATSKIAWKIFQWTDGDWYADDTRREWFRDIVQTNLTTVLQTASGERADDERLATANQKVKEVQAELDAAVDKCQAAEALVLQTHSQVQNLERALGDKSEDLLQTQTQLREARVKLEDARANISNIEAKLRETRKAAAAVEAELRDADARCLGLEEDLAKSKAELKAQATTNDDLAKESDRNSSKLKSCETRAQTADASQSKLLVDLKRNTAELESWISAAETAKAQAAELRSVVDQLQEQVVVLQTKAAFSGGDSASADLERALLDLNTKFIRLTSENEKLRDQLASAQVAIQSCESRIRPRTVDGGMQTADIDKGVGNTSSSGSKRAAETSCESSVDAELMERLEKTRSALKKLETENKQLRKALDGLHSNLKTVVNTCRESGVAMQVVDVIDKLELKKELKGAGMCAVWDRLYSDAMERIERMERSRKESVSPERRSMSHSLPDEPEQDWQQKLSPPQIHIHSPDHLESHRNPSKSALGADLPSVQANPAPKPWSLPPCSAPRPARCASAHRLRASRQASRGRTATAMSSTAGFGQSVEEYGAGLSPCRTPSLSPSKKNKVERSVSLPFLHGYKLSSWQGGTGL